MLQPQDGYGADNTSGWTALKILALIILAIGLLDAFVISLEHFRDEAKKSEVRGIAAAVTAAEKSYFAEFKTYSDDRTLIGFDPRPNTRLLVYMKPAETPADVSSLLLEDESPIVAKDSFRFLIILPCDHLICLALVTPNGVTFRER